jgi:two-component sensor histidine kinase/CheY-like chemotaxis protein
VLRLALQLTGATRALIAREDGEVLAELQRGAAEALSAEELARRALSDVDRTRTIATAPILDAGGTRVGVLAVYSGAPFSQKRFSPALQDLAAIAADELAGGGRADITQDELHTRFAEIDHRVKNVLASVQSIASQSARRAMSLDGFMKTFMGRLKAMASAQELLTATRWRGASIQDLATATLSALAPGQTRWEGPDIVLNPRAASALALALHELAVNAVKYGALSKEPGAVHVKWRARPDGGFELDWVEEGGPRVSAPTHRGFGSVVLEDVASRELDGKVTSEFRSSGLRVKIVGSSKVVVDAPEPPRPAPIPAISAGIPSLRRAAGVRGMKVIIVEDAMLLAMELEAGLAEAGAKVVGSAGEIEEAMALVDTPMDAAVLDCNLHGYSVEPVAEALAARGVPFLFATGYGENQGAPEGFDAPIVRKPYDVAQIAAALAELTGRA